MLLMAGESISNTRVLAYYITLTLIPTFQMVESVHLREHYAYGFAPDFTNIA